MIAIARTVSILGHPAAVSAAAMLFLVVRDDAGRMRTLALGTLISTTLVMGYSWWQVRRGRWAHVDASNRRERTSLHRVVLACHGLATLAAWQAGELRAVVLGLGVAAAIIAVAMASARWCKLSLHVAFAVYTAALLVRASPMVGAAAFAFAAAIAWSRLALARHTPSDLIAGAITGLAAGAAFAGLT